MTGNAVGDPESRRGDDLPGEALAGHDLVDPGDYDIAADETEAEELEEAAGDEVDIDDPVQLADAEADAREAESTEPETLAARVRSTRPQRKSVVVKKDAPTPARRRSAATPEEDRRATPAQFARQSAEFHAAWLRAGNRGVLSAQHGAHHFTAIHGFEQASSPLTRWLRTALDADR